MKIGIICQNYPPAMFEGGISHYSRLLAEGLNQRGHNVYALTSTEFTKLASEIEKPANVEIIRLDGPWSHSTVRKIKAIADKLGIEVLILQFSPASFNKSFRVMWGLTRFHCQKITAFHTLWGKGSDRILGVLTLWGSKKIIATNSEIMFLLEKYLPHLLARTYWIPIGSNIIPPAQDDVAHHSPIPLISYFGMLYPGKGLDLILDCLQEMRNRGHTFKFKFIGGGMLEHEQYEKNFREKIADRALQGDVEHLGLVPEEVVSMWLFQSRFVFLPYDRGLSDRRGTLMAAMAHGKAVLTSPPAVDMPFFKNGLNICWPEDNTLEGYIDLMERLLRNDMLVAHLESGMRTLAPHFCWHRIVAEHELVLQSA